MRFILLPLLLFFCSLHPLNEEPSPELNTPNILWILAEDMGPDLGFLGIPETHTPHLDELAARGMYFSKVFTPSPVCSPSRSALHTGMYQTTIGAHNHRSHREGDYTAHPFPLPDSVQLITDWLRAEGYYTGNIRHLDSTSWFQGTGKTDWNFTYSGNPFDTDQWADLKENQPFYAQINFSETHRGRAWNEAHTRIKQPARPDSVLLPPYYPNHPEVRADWAQYLNAVMAVDRKVGDILTLLKKDGLDEHTVVVFMADHGRAMVRAKQWPYDSGLHVPLIVYYPPAMNPPEGYAAGAVNEQLISSIDITATTLSIAGIQKPNAMQGRVLWGAQAESPRDYVFSGRDRGDETVDRIRTVRNSRYRYIRNYHPEKPFLQINRYKEATYPTLWVMRKLHQEGVLRGAPARLMEPNRPHEELYDIETDPYEIHNLATSSEHQEILRHLGNVLDEWIERSNDQGRIPESVDTHAFYESKMEANYDERIQQIWEERGIR